jgi:ferric-dicitrate binding protein FerR (iron transport regulator)
MENIGLDLHQRESQLCILTDDGEVMLKPSVLGVDVDVQGGTTVIAVRAGLVAVEPGGRMAAMLESGARLSAKGAIPEGMLPAYAARALDAAARTLCEDLAVKLGER